MNDTNSPHVTVEQPNRIKPIFIVGLLLFLFFLCSAIPFFVNYKEITKIESLGGSYKTEAGILTKHLPNGFDFWLRKKFGDRIFLPFENVTYLYLDSREVGDTDMETICNQSKLKELDLSYTKITDDGIINLNNLVGLSVLKMEGVELSDTGLLHLNGLPSLEELDLTDTQISNAGLVHLSNISSLRILDLTNTKITDEGLKHLMKMKSLRNLNLSSTKVTAGIIVYLDGFQNLEKLDVAWTNITRIEKNQLNSAIQNCIITIDPFQP